MAAVKRYACILGKDLHTTKGTVYLLPVGPVKPHVWCCPVAEVYDRKAWNADASSFVAWHFIHNRILQNTVTISLIGFPTALGKNCVGSERTSVWKKATHETATVSPAQTHK